MSNRTRNRRRQPRSVTTVKRIEPMIDATPSLCLEDPAAMADYQEHGEQSGQDQLCDLLADCLARSEFANLTTEDGQPIGEEVLTGLGWDIKRKSARDLQADKRFIITLAPDAS